MKILVIGDKGMLGHMVVRYLKQFYTVETTPYRWPDPEFKSSIRGTDAEYLVNCIGAIHQKHSEFDVNTELPVWLDKNFNGRIIHPGTDCEIDNDPYGASKRKASEYIKQNSTKTKILKTSIIGPELTGHFSLFDWFLYNKKELVYGYEDAMWNGVTTLTWAKECLKLIKSWNTYYIETILESTCISKFNLLSLLKEVFDKDINVQPVQGRGSNKCLVGGIKTPIIEDQLRELKNFYF